MHLSVLHVMHAKHARHALRMTETEPRYHKEVGICRHIAHKALNTFNRITIIYVLHL